MTTFEQKLQRKQELDAEISSIKNEIFNLAIPAAEMRAGDARARLYSFRSHYRSDAEIPEQRRGELSTLIETSKKTAAQLNDIQAKATKLKTSLAKLEAERAELSLMVSAKEALSIQEKIAAFDDEAAALLNAMESLDAGGNAGAESLLTLERRRAELMADAAMGTDVKQALSDIEKELAEGAKQVAAAIDREEARAALEIRLTACKQARAKYVDIHREAVAGYLKSCAEEIAVEYRRKAAALVTTVTRLIALHSLIEKIAPTDVAANQVGAELARLILPGMAYESPLFRAADIPLDVEMDKEREKVVAQGLWLTV